MGVKTNDRLRSDGMDIHGRRFLCIIVTERRLARGAGTAISHSRYQDEVISPPSRLQSRQDDLDALRSIESQAKALWSLRRADTRTVTMDKDIDLPLVNEADSLLKFLAEPERALEIYFPGHDRVGRHWDLAARQVADLDDRAPAAHIEYRRR